MKLALFVLAIMFFMGVALGQWDMSNELLQEVKTYGPSTDSIEEYNKTRI
ncbi:CLUMA_CG009445, isoform A [Clunio marinus]|uniref:CLUMA_CG009445, isoform A n=1 Tax=Clunio marinus TaxID=568069 RepID=A0A1J1I6U0_9DIPT|nr:CLUMA_CG009445, isoform A [Clunio marinus]